jgi:hypothetical protein
MGTKNVVIAMLCASIVILSIATPISAVKLENSGMSGEIDGTGVVTGSVSIEASTATDGTADVEASIEASVRLDGPGSAECSQEGPVTHTLETELGTIVADVSEDSKVEAAVEVVGEGKAQADAYVGTSANLGESEVEIVSEVSSSTYVETNGGSASATASATGTTTGDGTSYATGCAPNDATSHAEVSGDTEANVAVSGTAEAASYAAVGSTDYAGHYKVEEESYIEAGSYAGSEDGSTASADSSANGEAYQDGQAENCASSNTYVEGEVSSAVATEGLAGAMSGVYIWSYDNASKDTDEAYVYEESDIYAWSGAESDTDGKASAASSADGDTDAAGSACDCVYLDTSATGIVSSAVATEGLADAVSDTWIWSYGEAYKDTDEAYVEELSDIYAWSGAASDTDGKASADSASIGYTGAAGSACGCVYSDTSATGIVSSAVQTEGLADAVSDTWIWSYGEAYNGTDGAYVEELSDIEAWSGAESDTDGGASADSASIGYTDAAGSACGCVYSDTSAIGIVSSAVQTEGNASAVSDAGIWSYDEAYNGTDGAYVYEGSEIYAWSEAGSDTDGGASADSASIGYTGAAGSACDCVYSDTSAIGIVSSAVQTQGPAGAWSGARIWSYDYAEKDTNGAYVEEESSIEGRSEAGSDTDGGASAESASIGYTGAAGSACDCVDSWTKAKGAVEVKTETDGDAWISAFARLTSEGWIDIGIQMGANSVINTSATAQHDSNSEGTATADGSTKAGASNSCTGERVETGILYGEGETVVNPFDVMNTNTYAGFAYANAIPSGFEDIDFDVYIDTTGPNEAFSFTDAIAIIPAPAITTTP